MTYPSNDGPEDETQSSYRVTASELRAFVERVERLSAEKADLQTDIKEVFSEIKSRGYDPAVVRKLIADRKKDPQTISEFEAVLEMYKEALGDV